MQDAIWLGFILILIILCAGDPDIIDGWRARANEKCTSRVVVEPEDTASKLWSLDQDTMANAFGSTARSAQRQRRLETAGSNPAHPTN